jgi:hypothetical protein
MRKIAILKRDCRQTWLSVSFRPTTAVFGNSSDPVVTIFTTHLSQLQGTI